MSRISPSNMLAVLCLHALTGFLLLPSGVQADWVLFAGSSENCSSGLGYNGTFTQECFQPVEGQFFITPDSVQYSSAFVDCNTGSPYIGMHNSSNCDDGAAITYPLDGFCMFRTEQSDYVQITCQEPPPPEVLTVDITSGQCSDILGAKISEFDGCIDAPQEGHLVTLGRTFGSVEVRCAEDKFLFYESPGCEAESTLEVGLAACWEVFEHANASKPIDTKYAKCRPADQEDTALELDSCAKIPSPQILGSIQDGCVSINSSESLYTELAPGTAFHSYFVECDPANYNSPGVRFFTEQNCESFGPNDTLQFNATACMNVTANDQFVRVLSLQCAPAPIVGSGQRIDHDLSENQTCGVDTSIIASRLVDGCTDFPEGFTYAGETYLSMMHMCEENLPDLMRGYRLYTQPNCQSTPIPPLIRSLDCVEFGDYETPPASYSCLPKPAVPRDTGLVKVGGTCAPGGGSSFTSFPTSVLSEGCIEASDSRFDYWTIPAIGNDNITFSSMKVSCNDENPGFTFHVHSGCETDFEDVFIPQEVCAIETTEGQMPFDVTYYCGKGERYYMDPGARLERDLANCNATGSVESTFAVSAPFTCLLASDLGATQFVLNGENISSISTSFCGASVLRFYANEFCTGAYVTVVNSTCFELDVFGQETNELARLSCAAEQFPNPPPPSASAMQYSIPGQCIANASFYFPLSNGCIQGQLGGAIWSHEGQNYSSAKVQCEFGLPSHERGVILYNASNCTDQGANTGLMFGPVCLDAFVANPATGQIDAVAIEISCYSPPPIYIAQLTPVDQCIHNPLPTGDPRENVSDHCLTASSFGLTHFEAPQIHGSAHFLSITVKCPDPFSPEPPEVILHHNADCLSTLSDNHTSGTCLDYYINTTLISSNMLTCTSLYQPTPPPRGNSTAGFTYAITECNTSVQPIEMMNFQEGCLRNSQVGLNVWQIGGQNFSSVIIHCLDPIDPGFTFLENDDCTGNTSAVIHKNGCPNFLPVNFTEFDFGQLFCFPPVVMQEALLYSGPEGNSNCTAMYSNVTHLEDQCVKASDLLMDRFELFGNSFEAVQVNCNGANGTEKGLKLLTSEMACNTPFAFTNMTNDLGCFAAVSNIQQADHFFPMEIACHDVISTDPNPTPPPSPQFPTPPPRGNSTAGFTYAITECNTSVQPIEMMNFQEGCLRNSQVGLNVWQIGGQNFSSVIIHCLDPIDPGFTFLENDDCTGNTSAVIHKNGCPNFLPVNFTEFDFGQLFCFPPVVMQEALLYSGPEGNSNCTAMYSNVTHLEDQCVKASDLLMDRFELFGNSFEAVQVNCNGANGTEKGLKLLTSEMACNTPFAFTNMTNDLGCFAAVSNIQQADHFFPMEIACHDVISTDPNPTPPPSPQFPTPPPRGNSTAGFTYAITECNTSVQPIEMMNFQEGCLRNSQVGLNVWQIGGQNFSSVIIHCLDPIDPGFTFLENDDCTGNTSAVIHKNGCPNFLPVNFTEFDFGQLFCFPPVVMQEALLYSGPEGNSNCTAMYSNVTHLEDQCVKASDLARDRFELFGNSFEAVQVNCNGANGTEKGLKLLTSEMACNTPFAFTNMTNDLGCFAAVSHIQQADHFFPMEIACHDVVETANPTSSPVPSPTTRQPTSKAPTSLSPTSPPSTATPTSSPTGKTPVLLGAKLTKDLLKIEVDFDDNTNQRKQPQRGPCSPWLQLFANDTGCAGGSPCPLNCLWTSPKRLVVELNPQSNSNTTFVWWLRINANSSIGHAFALSGFASGTVNVTFPVDPIRPTLSLSGPSVVSLCGQGEIAVLAQVGGTGGRLPVLEWKVNNVPVVNATSPRLVLPRPQIPAVRNISAKVTNYAGEVAFSSPIIVSFVSDLRAQVSLSAPSSFAVDSTASIDLSSFISLPAACIPPGFTLADVKYKYDWKITLASNPDRVFSNGIVGLNRSRLLISPASILPPGEDYKIELEVDPRLVGVLIGKATTVVTVNPVPVIAILSGPTVFSVEKTRNLVLDATRSCDPNIVVPLCRVGTGQAAQNLTGLTVQWTCRHSTDTVCDELCSVSSPVGTCLVTNGSLTHANSPYTFVATVTSSLSTAPSSLTPVVTVNVLPDLTPQCIRPVIEMQSFPTKINVGQSGEAQLRSVVRNFDFNPTEGRIYQWFLVNRENGGSLSSPASLVGDSVSLNQPNLALQLSKLIPGSSYVFRLVAFLPCTGGSNVFGEVSFVTNSPPGGGVLTVSPMTARAGLDEFILSVDGASDEDLPLQYSFEYRNDFNRTDNAAFFTMSSWSQSSTITTRFSTAPRIMVIARIRDSLLAATTRAQSPFVDNVEATEFLVTPETVLFNASFEMQNLLGSGGSEEDALRAATALASAAATNLPASELPLEVVQWAQETQSALLNLVASGGDSGSTDPSFVMLQTSTLSSILSSAEAIQDVTTPEGQEFLSKATTLVGDLLDNIQAAVLAQGTGSDDPLLTQYRPEDIGDVTVENIKSILNAIRLSSSDSSRRRRRLLREHAPRWLQVQEASGQIVTSVRDQLRKLADVMLLGAVSGSAPQVINGAEMRIVTVAEIPGMIGTDSKLTAISIPAFDDNDPPTVFTLPRDVLGGFSFEDTENSLVNIIAVRFRFNIRELAGGVNAPNFTLDENAPANNVTEMLALDFQRNSTDRELHPFNLTDGIKIRIPLEYQELDNTTKLSCGFFDVTINTWSSSGCNVTEFSLPANQSDDSGYMICECNHASDYAAWLAFVKDVNSVFNPVDTSNLSTIAALVLGVLLPSLALVWIGSQRLANYMDKRDSDYVHYGAFVSMTKRKLELHDRQRRFFKILRDNTGPILKADLAKYEALADEKEKRSADEKVLQAFRTLSKRMLLLVFLGSLGASALMFSGIFVSFYFESDEHSLMKITMDFDGAFMDALGLSFASGIISFVCGIALLWVLLFRDGEISPGISVSFGYIVLLVLQLVNLCLGISSFAVPLAHRGNQGVGVGLALVIISGCVSTLNCLFAWAGFFLHQLGHNVKTLRKEFMNNIAMGLLYEQTLLSAFSRFDPYFDRSKRFSIVIAVIIGNLFACSVFLSLRNGEGVSFGLVLASTIVSSLIVAVPVKITLRILFRVTKMRTGSKLDRIAHIFRITAFTNDVHPAFASEAEKLDVQMLDAFRRFYLAKQNVKILKKVLQSREDAKLKESGLQRSLLSRVCAGVKDVFMCGGEDDEDEDAPGAVQAESTSQRSFNKKVDGKTGEFEYGEIMDIRDLAPDQINAALLVEARQQFANARRVLKQSVERSQKAWAGQEYKYSYVSRKQWLVQREKNAFLKWALAVGDEPRARPKVANSILNHRWVIFGWLVLLSYYIGCILWICFWIFSRNGQSEQALVQAGSPNPTQEEIGAQTNAYLLAWLATSFFGIFLGYFVFEPAFVVLRFAILPTLVKALRPLDDLKVEDVPIELVEAEITGSVRDLPKHLMLEDEDKTEEVKRGCFLRMCCCCCSAQRVAGVQKRVMDVVVLLIEALV